MRAIIGGSIGAVATVTIVAGAIFCWKLSRKHAKRQELKTREASHQSSAVLFTLKPKYRSELSDYHRVSEVGSDTGPKELSADRLLRDFTS